MPGGLRSPSNWGRRLKRDMKGFAFTRFLRDMRPTFREFGASIKKKDPNGPISIKESSVPREARLIEAARNINRRNKGAMASEMRIVSKVKALTTMRLLGWNRTLSSKDYRRAFQLLLRYQMALRVDFPFLERFDAKYKGAEDVPEKKQRAATNAFDRISTLSDELIVLVGRDEFDRMNREIGNLSRIMGETP